MSDIEEKPRPGLRFLWLSIVTAVLLAVIGGGVVWSDATTTPKLALDLEGGTSIILEPQVSEDTDISQEQLDQAVSIIRQRVDSTGVSEAEITTQGDRNIVVNLPGNPDEETRNLVRSSAQLVFRRVALVGDPRSQEQIQKEQEKSGGGEQQQDPSEGLTDEQKKRLEDLTGGSSGAQSDAGAQGDASGQGSAGTQGQDSADAPAGGGEVSNAGGNVPGPAAKDAEKSAQKSGEQASGESGSGTGEDTKVTDTTPRPLFDPEKDTDKWQTDAIIKKYSELDCTDPKNRTGGQQKPSDEPVVACGTDGQAKYILGPVELSGEHLADASAGYAAGANGVQTNQPAVNLEFDSVGREIFKQITSDITGKQQPYNQFAITLDGNVLSAPSSNAAITDGNAQITGQFTLDEAQTLADQLKNGSLPLSFQVQSENQISPTLGTNYLNIGLLTGLVGLLLVVVYSLLQYRVLGLVTVSSLVVAGVLTYLLLLLASWRYGYRLSLAGVAGIIIGIGMAADSFIVYFERVRDELRSGRKLLSAVEVGWDRAKRTIWASKAVNMLAAVILYVLAVGSVRGFAFTLGLTVIIDVLIVFLFTHPMLEVLARTKFFGQGHPMSGMDPRLLGVKPASYRGALNLSIDDSEKSAEGRRREKARTRKAGMSADAEAESAEASTVASSAAAQEAPELSSVSSDSAVSSDETVWGQSRGTTTTAERSKEERSSDPDDGTDPKASKPTKAEKKSKKKPKSPAESGRNGSTIAERKAAAKKAAEDSADKGKEADK
ncbi:preprotein translocase subunit SecD [Brevibacterium sandarakinum]|uniref:Protein translocase subunit SecD n=1 Tax=Brevibacterium sandarakinum TaxID=629680 RepID=A0A1H1XNV1_BRESA|nr:protein translocase subunit SecD [Brevibacterium sandarakinum]SDT10908.1 preprotein translocase subunit SecD [Brevibacterium sandarakinum]